MINSFSGKADGYALVQSVLRQDGMNSELNSLSFYQKPSQNPQQNPRLEARLMPLTPADEVLNLQKQGMPPEGQFHSL
jgi:hypothetical protein